MFKKLLCVVLTGALMFTMAGCSEKEVDSVEEEIDEIITEDDLALVKDKKTLVVGITDFEPMDYKDESGEWIGFDADVAREYAKSLGVEVKFVEIDWDNKVLELNNKSIDCVWNGMTLTDEVESAMTCSIPYCNNAQVVIVPSDKADQYQTVDSLKELNFAVEVGGAGAAQANENGLKYTAVANQAAALMEVASGTSDAAIIDSLMAAAMVGEGTSYDKLTYTVSLNSEEYGVGFRKYSNMAESLNAFLKESYDNGFLMKTAEKYGVQAALIEQK